MSEATTGVAHANARVSTIPKLSPPSDGAASAFARAARAVSSSCERKPRMSMPSCGIRCRASWSRTASGSAPTRRRRAPVRRWIVGPRLQQHGQALALVVAADEDDEFSRFAGSAVRRDEHAVRDDLEVAGAGATAAPTARRRVGDGDPVVDPVDAGSPRAARRAASSRARRPRGRSRPSGTSRRRASRRRSPASSARACAGRRTAPRSNDRASAGTAPAG